MDSDASSYEHLRAQAKEILNSPDVSSMETIVTYLMSTQLDDAQRSQAHQLFNFFKKHYPGCLSIKLACLLRYSPHVDTQTNAAILLRRALTRLESHLWPNLLNSTQSHLRGHIFACFKKEHSEPVSDIIYHIIAEIGTETFTAGGQWPELTDFLFQSVVSDSDELYHKALLVFTHLQTKGGEMVIAQMLILHHDTLRTVFLQRLASDNPDVRNVAFEAVADLISFFPYRLELLQAMVMVLKSFLKSNEEYAQKCLKKFAALAMKDVQILMSDLKNVVECMLDITEDYSLSVTTQYCAVEFMITLVELRDKVPGLMPMPRPILTDLFFIPMRMLGHIADDPAWYDMESEKGEHAGKELGYHIGIKCLKSILIASGGDTVMMRAFFDLLPIFMDDSEWNNRHSGITTLAVVAEGCSKVLEYLERVLTKILNLFQDPHPRVRWETFHAIEQVSTHLGPPMPVFYCQMVLPALAAAIEEHQIPKVKAQAALAMLSFIKNCTSDFLALNLDGIVRTLLIFLQDNDRTTKERSIAFHIFYIVALQCREAAFKYYGTCLPFLLNACSDENPVVRQEAARGISICAEFGRSEFKPFVGGAISSLNALIEDPNILDSNGVKAHEISVSALGKICEFHCDNINAAQVIPAWLNLLPNKSNLIEAKIVH